ncbi:MAG: 3-methyl-2-oxobutanoate dehydrogenase subunit VorB [bacterium]|nr:3-methyl-2-oxobutanoate dehydrogenase subunit VorB [bacterium]
MMSSQHGNSSPPQKLMAGNHALAEGAIQAGCDAYFGYPITPQNEIPEYMAARMPEEGRVFVQSESELAAISMVMGAAVTGKRAMTTSSSPGISLMQEGISYLCGCELPAVIANVVRGGPGLGNIAAAQSDYFQAVKGGGHGDYHLFVLAPASVQEMFDFAFWAFDLAFKYRNPVMILTDGLIGQMMEPLTIREPSWPRATPVSFDARDWALTGAAGRPPRSFKSLFLGDGVLEAHNAKLQAKYARAAATEVRYETVATEDAQLLLVAYGIMARVCRETVDRLRARGIKAGLLRPLTLWPFPTAWLAAHAAQFAHILVVELSCGQMVEDVQLAVQARTPVSFYGRAGGGIVTCQELTAVAIERLGIKETS